MNIELAREYCLAKQNVQETMPFDDDTLVFKVTLRNGKSRIFSLLSISRPDYLLVKCNPDLAIELRERYPNSVEPGFHMNKKHWNGVIFNDELTDKQIYEMIDHSYSLVRGKF